MDNRPDFKETIVLQKEKNCCVNIRLYRQRMGADITLTQIPHPIQSSSEMMEILSDGVTSIHSFPIRTTGHERLHSWRQRFGLHRSLLTTAIRVTLEDSSSPFRRDMIRRKQIQSSNCRRRIPTERLEEHCITETPPLTHKHKMHQNRYICIIHRIGVRRGDQIR